MKAAPVALVLSALALPAYAQTPIGCGQTLAGSIGVIGEQDTFTFAAAAGEAVILTAVATTGVLQARLDLFNPSGQLVRPLREPCSRR